MGKKKNFKKKIKKKIQKFTKKKSVSLSPPFWLFIEPTEKKNNKDDFFTFSLVIFFSKKIFIDFYRRSKNTYDLLI